MSHILSQAALLLCLALAVYVPGHLIERLRPTQDLRALARWIYGLASWSVGLFLLATVGLLNGLGLTLLLSLNLCVPWFLGRQRRAQDKSTDKDTDRDRDKDTDKDLGVGEQAGNSGHRLRAGLGRPALLWGLLITLVLPIFMITLGPTRSWDAEVYHLSIPKIYVDHGGFRPVEMSVYSNWPLGAELFFAGAMIVGDFVTAKTVHWGFGLLVFLALMQGFGRSLAFPLAACLLFFANDVVQFEMRSAYVDLALAFYVLSLFFFLCRAADTEDTEGTGCSSEHRRYLWLAGLTVGLLAGVKITGVIMAGLVCLFYLPRLQRDLQSRGLPET